MSLFIPSKPHSNSSISYTWSQGRFSRKFRPISPYSSEIPRSDPKKGSSKIEIESEAQRRFLKSDDPFVQNIRHNRREAKRSGSKLDPEFAIRRNRGDCGMVYARWGKKLRDSSVSRIKIHRKDMSSNRPSKIRPNVCKLGPDLPGYCQEKTSRMHGIFEPFCKGDFLFDNTTSLWEYVAATEKSSKSNPPCYLLSINWGILEPSYLDAWSDGWLYSSTGLLCLLGRHSWTWAKSLLDIHRSLRD